MRFRVVAGAAAACLFAGCGSDGDGPRFGMPEPASEQGERIVDLWQGFFVTAVVVAAVVIGLVLYVVIKYRQRSGDESIPDQNPYNVPLEVLYTVTPIIVVAGLFAFSTLAERDVGDLVAEPAVTIEVVGFQWQWRFSYPDEGITLVGTPEDGPPEIVVPVGEVVRFELSADDVVHSFWVPAFVEKRDVLPGVHNEIDITPSRTGTFVGRCAEFCGLDHWRMSFTVRVVEPSEYETWVADHAEAAT